MLTRENLTNKKGLQLENILFKSKNVITGSMFAGKTEESNSAKEY